MASAFPSHQIPLPIYMHMKFHPKTGRYYPVMYLNEFWLTGNRKIPVNATLDELPLVLHFRCEGQMKWLMVVQVGACLPRPPPPLLWLGSVPRHVDGADD
jgi:hypothetical protein